MTCPDPLCANSEALRRTSLAAVVFFGMATSAGNASREAAEHAARRDCDPAVRRRRVLATGERMVSRGQY